jgi:hypothetical protein
MNCDIHFAFFSLFALQYNGTDPLTSYAPISGLRAPGSSKK